MTLLLIVLYYGTMVSKIKNKTRLKCIKTLLRISGVRIMSRKVDWAGFEPAIFRLRIERSYQAEPSALDHYFKSTLL